MLESLLLKLAQGEHLPEPLPAEPITTLIDWFEHAMREGATPMPNSMALATATPQGVPSVRFVLCKAIGPAGSIDFFTNFNSRKGDELAVNPRVAGVFYWHTKARQARVEGTAERLSDEQADAYFATRPLASKLGAWASRQSEALPTRKAFVHDLLVACQQLRIEPTALLDANSPLHVPRPPHWGGFRVKLDRVELWYGAAGRLHDRACWTRSQADAAAGVMTRWQGQRLYP